MFDTSIIPATRAIYILSCISSWPILREPGMNKFAFVAGTALKHGQVLHAFVDKACLKLMKIFVEVQSTHPYSFSNRVVLPSVLGFCYIQITEVKEDNVPFEPFLIKCMIFVQSVIQCGAYRPNKTGRVVGQSTTTMEETKANLARQAEEIVMSLLNKQRLVVLCEILVRRYKHALTFPGLAFVSGNCSNQSLQLLVFCSDSPVLSACA